MLIRNYSRILILNVFESLKRGIYRAGYLEQMLAICVYIRTPQISKLGL